VLDEILEERVASSRGRQVPRGVKRKMSGYQLRPRTPQPTTWIDFAAAIRIVNDRVGRQACFQAVLVRSMALSVTTSLRMQAVSASLAGFPARRSRS
jgi:hypothetical protein